MSFLWPGMLALVLCVPLAAAGYLWLVRRRAEHRHALAAQGFVPNTAAGRLRRWRHVPAGLFLAALAVLIVALARPQLDFGLPQRKGTVVLAFDVSNSMLATDITPTRIDAAKAAAKQFVEEQPSTIDVGIVAFNNGALITQQPTDARADTVAAIDRLAPAGATSLGQGIFAALSAIVGRPLSLPPDASVDDIANADIGYYGSGAIVLLSDGENTSGPDAVAAAELASTAGVRVYTIGIGSPQGAVLQVGGFSIATALDEEELTAIASVTNGEYFAAQDADTLAGIYRNLDLRTVTDPKLTEVTAAFAGASLLLLLVGGALSVLLFGRLV